MITTKFCTILELNDSTLKIVLLILLPIFSYAQSRKEFYDSLNHLRELNGLHELRRSITLEIASKRWVNKLIKKYNYYLMHDMNAGFEIIAYGGDAFYLWLHSEPHKKVMLNRRTKRVGYANKNSMACARFR